MRYDFTDEEYKKLPRWAQQRVSSMRHRIHELESLQQSQVKTDVRFGRNMEGEDGYLPHQTPVRIHFTEHDSVEFLKLDSEDGIRVTAMNGALLIKPTASNAISIKVATP